MTGGYSGTPLAKKLGLKMGQAALLVSVPECLAGMAVSTVLPQSNAVCRRVLTGASIIFMSSKRNV